MKTRSGSAVPRHMIFVLEDGEPVVQWTELHVQELLSGKYRQYHAGMFGHAVLDRELEQLKASGRVEYFNRQYIWVYALPENNRFALRTDDAERRRQRTFYINTTLPAARLADVEAAMSGKPLSTTLSACVQDDLVTVWRQAKTPFADVVAAEDALHWLVKASPSTFSTSTVAFIDVSVVASAQSALFDDPIHEPLTLDAVISAMDTTETRAISIGRSAVLALPTLAAAEREAVQSVLTGLKVDGLWVSNAREALNALQFSPPDMLVSEAVLPDLHGWQLLSRARDADLLRNLAIIFVEAPPADAEHADHRGQGADPALTLGVMGVDDYLTRPLHADRIWSSVLAAFKRRT